MKRFFASIIVMFSVVGLVLAGSTAANAKQNPVPTDSTKTPNVQISYYHDTESNTNYVVAWRFAPTKRDPYRWIECKPSKCGDIVVSGKRNRAKASLQLTSGEMLVSGWYGYTTNDWSSYVSGKWDGSSMLVNRRFKTNKGKPVRMHLDSLYADVYNPAFPVPVYDDCVDCYGGK